MASSKDGMCCVPKEGCGVAMLVYVVAKEGGWCS